MTNVEIIRRWAGQRWSVPWRSVIVRVVQYGKHGRFVAVALRHPGRHGEHNELVHMPIARRTRGLALHAAALWVRRGGR